MFGKKKNEDYSVKTVKVGVDKLTTIALGTMVKGPITTFPLQETFPSFIPSKRKSSSTVN